MGITNSEKIRLAMKIKATITTLLIISFLIVFVTGVMLHIKFGVPSNAPLGLKLHIVFGYIMGVLVIVHFVFNFQLYANELKCLFTGNCEMMKFGMRKDVKREG